MHAAFHGFTLHATERHMSNCLASETNSPPKENRKAKLTI